MFEGDCFQDSHNLDLSFLSVVRADLRTFVIKNDGQSKRVLVFPALNSRRRYQIHSLVKEEFSGLASFSVGSSADRRLIVAREVDIIRPLETPNNITAGTMEEKEQKPRSGCRDTRSYVYVPPPARKEETASGTTPKVPSRTNERRTSAGGSDKKKKVCEDSSLLFLRSSNNNPASLSTRRKKKKSKKNKDTVPSPPQLSPSPVGPDEDDTTENSNNEIPNTLIFTRSSTNEDTQITTFYDLDASLRYLEANLSNVSLKDSEDASKLTGKCSDIYDNDNDNDGDQMNPCDDNVETECYEAYESDAAPAHELYTEPLDVTSHKQNEDDSKGDLVFNSRPQSEIYEDHSSTNEQYDSTLTFEISKNCASTHDSPLDINHQTPSDCEEYKNDMKEINDQTTEDTPPATQKDAPSVNDDYDWESLYSDDGNCLKPEVMPVLTDIVGPVKILKPASSYKEFQTQAERDSDGSNIVELYDFPSDFKTKDLMTVFSTYSDKGLFIKWVDDTHALAVFPTSMMADEVLAGQWPFVKTRPLRSGLVMSREKAKCLTLPPALRPKTHPGLARRLVTGALGLRLPVSSTDREEERKILNEAREQRRLAILQRNAAWDGTLGSKKDSGL